MEKTPFKHIEFMGPVGSGKSTLYSHIKKISLQHDPNVLDKREALFHSLQKELSPGLKGKILKVMPRRAGSRVARRLFFESRTARRYTLEFIQENMEFFHFIQSMQLEREIPRSHKQKIIEWFLHTGMLYQFFKKNLDSGFTLIFGEGFIYGRANNLFVSTNEEVRVSLLKEYLRKIPMADLLICVDAPSQVCFHRLQSRGLPQRLRRASNKEIIRFIQNSIIMTQEILDFVKNNCPQTYIIELDNSVSMESAVSTLQRKIDQYFQQKEI